MKIIKCIKRSLLKNIKRNQFILKKQKELQEKQKEQEVQQKEAQSQQQQMIYVQWNEGQVQQDVKIKQKKNPQKYESLSHKQKIDPYINTVNGGETEKYC
ncbi:unnamed protein product (macronuclear) [Paramecium tetraurelia]|uniref:Uncharacterized protein n=1 Tax=Paramecium tetraurelia TaxID=5888 RepID=A0EGT2_PARTE|nr:uncharacterized protein GSPATT00026847001 [Paramecium tetraurelia]CAK94523.1 unnamed protein product [Paramecium tetraurelia]|eukprot:XP_001461896.1 hypothetical protein (macronuclear) [Paramecium tetraurelia strain d4-2]